MNKTVSTIISTIVILATLWVQPTLPAQERKDSLLEAAKYIQTAPQTERADISTVQLLTPIAGWVLTNRGILFTEDGGGQWQNITPPAAVPSSILGVHFINSATGWVLGKTRNQQGATSDELTLSITTSRGSKCTEARFPTDTERLPESASL